MCMYIRSNAEKATPVTPRTSKEPIKCVKVVLKRPENPDVFYPPFWPGGFVYKVGEVAQARRTLQESAERAPGWNGDDNRLWIESGLSSFKPGAKGIESVKHWIESEIRLGYYTEYVPTVLECEIPAGTLYYEGEHYCCNNDVEGDEPGYCSEYLKVIREL